MAFVFVRKYAILLAAQNKDPGAAMWCGDIGRSVVGLKRGARAKRRRLQPLVRQPPGSPDL